MRAHRVGVRVITVAVGVIMAVIVRVLRPLAGI
jgi:hypothetical protein